MLILSTKLNNIRIKTFNRNLMHALEKKRERDLDRTKKFKYWGDSSTANN